MNRGARISVCFYNTESHVIIGEDHQLHHCCWTGRVGEREEEDNTEKNVTY